MCIAGGRIDHLDQSKRPEGFKALRTTPGVRHLPAHEHLFFEGDIRDCVYVIETGWVKLYRTLVDGQRQVVGFANGGSILGMESEGEYLNACEAVTPVTVRSIPVASIPELCRVDTTFAGQLLRQLGRQLGAAQTQLATVGAQSAEQKLATFLLSIADLCGVTPEGELLLIDELMTPDSSRYWPADQYAPGGPQPSFDKQFVRDYLESIRWNKQPPVPSLPDEVVARTRDKYLDAYRRLTGAELASAAR